MPMLSHGLAGMPFEPSELGVACRAVSGSPHEITDDPLLRLPVREATRVTRAVCSSALRPSIDAEPSMIQTAWSHQASWIRTLGAMTADAMDPYRDRVLQLATGVRPR